MGKRERRGWTMLVVGMILMGMVEGHIRLTSPPARKYQFDFLDNVRTPEPCGMPAGLDGSRTMLKAGSTLDIHWHLSYPHTGSYFFEVRNQTDAVIARYPPGTDFVGTQDGTSLNYTVVLPSAPCENCTFRMVRQAREWGPRYLFWSCSDVSIVPAVADSYYCSGNGVMQGGACVCNRLYKGDKCQFKEECEADSDCGSNGMCVDTRATSYPIHQCYCRQGWFGPRCEKKSSVTTTPTDMGVYSKRVLSTKSDVTVYYRIVDSEVEVMVRAKTTTWMGFGWRPASTDKTCQNFPDLKDDRYKMAEPEAEGKPEGKGEAEAETKPEGGASETKPEGEGAAETKPEGEGAAETKPEGEGAAETKPEGEGAAETKPEGEGAAETKPEGTAEGEATAETGAAAETAPKPEGETKPEGTAEVHAEGEPSSNSTAEAEGTAEAHAEGTAEEGSKAEGYPEGHAEGEAEAHPEGEAEGHPEGEAEGHAEGEAEGEGEAESSSGLHPMDCTDIVIGSAKGSYSRIGDYYTRDRSTPVHDEYLGGENSLTAGLVWEEQGYTVMLFRKKLKAHHRTDHSLENEVTHVLWAVGQQKDASGRYNHFPSSALESLQVSIPDFYREDELKYHGHQGQRGAAAFNFYPDEVKKDDDDCERFSCPAKTCGMDVSWTYDRDSDLLTFNITAKYVAEDQWIALGFSDNETMEGSDVIFGGMSGGKPFVRDGWLDGKRPPKIDSQQDARLLSGGHADSRTSLVFSRKRKTGDTKDMDLSQRRYVFFANKGGKIRSPDDISQHVARPIISAQRLSFGVCEEDVIYATRVTIRFPGFEYREAFSNPNSDDFKQTAKKLTPELEKLLKPELGSSFKHVTVLDLRKGSLIVVFEVQTQAKASVTQADAGQQVKTAVQSLDKQTVEGYGALELKDIASTYRVDDSVDRQPSESPLTETEIIIIAIVLALVLVAVLIGLCKFLEARRARQHDKQRVMGGESASQDSTSKGKMSYGEFMATSANGGDPMAQNGSSGYPAFVNPGYESAGYKMAS